MQRLTRRVRLEEIVEKLKSIEPFIPPGVVRWRYTFDDDWSGDPAIYFWVVLTDEANERENRRKAAGAFEKLIDDKIEPYEEWGLLAYFHFRSESEQAKLKGKEYE